MVKEERFKFVVDTEQYAGNFERELCAYVTGRWDQETHGRNEAALYEKETGKDPLEFVEDRPVEHDGYYNPAPQELFPTPGWFNNGMGGHFKDGQESEALEAYKEENRKHYGALIKEKLGKDLKDEVQRKAGWTKEAVDREVRGHRKDLRESESLKEVRKYPAYLSVAIFCEREPTPKEIKLMKDRCRKFSAFSASEKQEEWKRRKIKITGFRLVKETITTEVQEQEV